MSALVLLSACCLFLQTASVFRSFQLMQHKAHIRAILNEEEHHTTLRFTLTEWQALQHPEPNEVVIHGERFDIKSMSCDGEQICVVGCYDRWETAWYQRRALDTPHGMHPLWVAFFFIEYLESPGVPHTLYYITERNYPIRESHLCSAPVNLGFKPPEEYLYA